MNTNEQIKDVVKEKYSKIAQQSKEQNESSCCGSGSCCGTDYTIFSENYETLKGYNPDADLGLGCGIPTEFALIKEGNTVLDLGSGAGNDCFVARAIVGEKGKVFGLDFTDTMIDKANQNVKKLGFTNVQFIKGDIEHMPIDSEIIDVVISNCVLNLVPDKNKAFAEIYRVLKNGAHFCVSDVVIQGILPENLRRSAEMYAGCVSGALAKDDYLNIIKQSGFKKITIHKERQIEIPGDILKNYLNEKELLDYRNSPTGIFSITVSAQK